MQILILLLYSEITQVFYALETLQAGEGLLPTYTCITRWESRSSLIKLYAILHPIHFFFIYSFITLPKDTILIFFMSVLPGL